MRGWKVCLTGCVIGAVANPTISFAAAFSAGNIVVTRVGDGSVIADPAAAAPVFLDEFTPTGLAQVAPVNTVTLPAGSSGVRLTLPGDSGGTAGMGTLTRSNDGRYLLIGGYDAEAVVTANLVGTSSPGTSRVVGLIDMNGTVDTSTRFTDNSFSTQNITSVASPDGTQIWVAGRTNADRSGIRYTTRGSSTSLRINQNTSINARVVNIFPDANNNLQLYTSTSGNTVVGKAGNGLQTTQNNANNPAALPGLGSPNTSGISTYDYWFASPTTVYITDDNGSDGSTLPALEGSGIIKYSLISGVWVPQYTMNEGLSYTNMRELTGMIDGDGHAVLFAIMGNGEQLVSVVDTGCPTGLEAGCSAADTFYTLATAAENTSFRGVEFAPIPEPVSAILLGLGGLLGLSRRKRAS